MSKRRARQPEREDLFGITCDFVAKLQSGAITPQQAKLFLRKEKEGPSEVALYQEDWWKVYHCLGLGEKEFNDNFHMYYHSDSVSFDEIWTVPVWEKVTPNQVVKALEASGVKVHCLREPDSVVNTENRKTRGFPYGVAFLRNQLADCNLVGVELYQLEAAKLKAITLLERLLLELAYFLKTGEHLDWTGRTITATLCAGSLFQPSSEIPTVYYNGCDLQLHIESDRWFSSQQHLLRPRIVVT